MRIRTTNKIASHTYVSKSWNINGNWFLKLIYFIGYLYYLIFKYIFYVPIKWIIDKFKKKNN